SLSASAAPQLNPEEVAQKLQSMVSDYFAAGDFNDVELTIKECGGREAIAEPLTHDTFMHVAMDSSKERDFMALAKLYYQLVEKGYLDRAVLESGFVHVLRQAEDIAMENANIHKYLANMVSYLIGDGALSLAAVPTLTKAIVAPEGMEEDDPEHIKEVRL